MTDQINTENPELDALFERYRRSPDSHVFAPLADACRKAGMVREAIEIVDRGIQANPDYPSGFVVRGKCYFDSGDTDRARDAFERVIELDANNLVALKYLGIILADRGDAEAAREHFKQILVLDPDDRGIRENLELLASDARSKDDIDDEGFEGASIQLGDDDGSASDELATTTLADIYASQGYTDKAIRIYREVLARQPDNAEVRDKIRSLEGEPAPEQADEPATGSPATGSPATGSPATGSPATGSPGPIIELPADDDVVFEEVPESGSASRPMLPRTRPRPRVPFALGHEQKPAPDERRGTPIDEGRSYEQFKRWLKNIAD